MDKKAYCDGFYGEIYKKKHKRAKAARTLMTVSAIIAGMFIVSMELIGAIQWLRLGYTGAVSWWRHVQWGTFFRASVFASCMVTLALYGIYSILYKQSSKAFQDWMEARG